MTINKIRALCAGLLAIIAATGATCAHARDVIVRTTWEMSTTEDKKVPVTAYTFSSSDVRARVMPGSTLRLASDTRSGLSVRDVDANARLTAEPGKWLLVSNGGFSGARSDRPVGLLITEGKILSLPDYSRVRGDPESDCPERRTDRYRLSGVLCVAKSGGIGIGDLDQAELETCQEALQAGPLLIDSNRRNAICASDVTKTPYHRTVLCTAGSIVSVIVTSEPVHLYDFAAWLVANHNANTKPSTPGGLGACTSAINLSGGTSSGSFLHPRSGPTIFDGPGQFPQATFLVVRPNK